MRLLLCLALAAPLLAACASDGETRPAYVVVEENAEIRDRTMIRRISVLEDDTLLVDASGNELFRVRLFPGCVSFPDTGGARLDETGFGLNRSSRFIINGRTCSVRSIDRIEQTRPAPEGETPAQTAS